jgi:hypothetical protein
MTNQSAVYTVTPILEDPYIDRGGKLKLELYFSGQGDVKNNKLHIQFPLDRVFEKDSSSIVRRFENEEGITEITDRADNIGHTMGLDEEYFKYDTNSDSPEEFGRVNSERSYQGKAPLSVELQTKEDAVPGDYAIPITFTYKSEGDELRQDFNEINFHVNSWQEENRKTLEVIAAIAAILTVLSIVGGSLADMLIWLISLFIQGFVLSSEVFINSISSNFSLFEPFITPRL